MKTDADLTDSKAEMPQSGIPWRTFPIFISSTFADMQAERDHLKNVVFPLVEEELQKRRIKLEIVDLRWGVDTTSMEQEDEREANVLKVCLDEIRRCRPFFIGLLGDRYGWVPPLERMKTALVGETHIKPEKGKSVTDLEIEFGVLASQEQLVRSVFYFRRPLPYATFSKKKAAMFSDEYNDELSEAEKKERKNALLKLKTKIVEHFTPDKLENKVKTYSCIWDAKNEKLTGLETWGNIVKSDILAECESHAKDTWDKVPQNWQEQELALLDAFIENNTATFCGRKPLLETLKKHLLSNDSANWGVVLTGESGSGKSAVFSMMNKLMQQENCFILAHSAGISPRAKKVADLLKIWNNLLRKHLGINQVMEDTSLSHPSPFGEGPGVRSETPIEELQKLFTELLQLASAKKKVVLLIDALDRFEPTARAQHLSWLPAVMPQNVRLLCTAITGTEQKAVQYHKGLTTKSIDVFSSKEAKEMLDALCARQHKSLPPKIESIILDKKRADGQRATSSPLWLSLAVNMLMAIDHDDFEKMSQLEGRGDQQIESYITTMANGFDPLPGPLFLSLKNKAGVLFGEAFTTAIFNYIAISRNGLREKDLEKLLPEKTWDPLQFAGLRRWFKAHLVLQGEELQWNLAHSILKITLLENLTPVKYTSTHFVIASHLLTLPGNDTLRASETMFHLLESENLLEAANYYGGYLTESETLGSTIVMAEAIAASEKGLKKVIQLPHLLVNQFALLQGILRKYIYILNDELAIEGNLKERQILLTDLYKILHNKIDLKTNHGLIYDFAGLLWNLGSILHSMGHIEVALNYIKQCLKIIKKIYEARPHDLEIKHRLAISHSKLGDIHKSMGQIEEAIKYYTEEFILFKELQATYPSKSNKGLAISYSKLGSIHQSMGHMEEALKYFENSNQLFKELYKANPRSESLKNDLAMSYSNLGDIYQSMGQLEEALKYFNNEVRLFREIYEANPRSQKIKKGLAISYEKLGIIHQSMGHVEEAHKVFKIFNQFFKELFEADTRSETMKNGLAISYQFLGIICSTMGQMEEALKYFELYYQLIKELYEANPKNELLKKDLAISYEKLGSLHKSMNHMEDALNYFELFNKIFKELNEAVPRSELMKNGLAVSYERLGSIHQSMGHMEEALKYFENNNQFSKELYEANPRSEEMKNGLAISYSRLGDIHQSMRHMEKALKYFENNLELKKELHEANPLRESLKYGLAISYGKLGSIHQSMGHMEVALKYFENDLELTKELYEANPRNINLLEGLGISFYKLAMLYKAVGNNTTGKEQFAEWKKIISFLAANLPEVQKYGDWDKLDFDSPAQNKAYLNTSQTDTNNDDSYPIQTETNTDDVLTSEQKLLYNFIQNNQYDEALEILKVQEETLRNKKFNPVKFQENVGEQAFVLSKLGRYKEALQKYEIQSESFARTQMYEDYADCLLSQAELFIDFLGKPKEAKGLLEEAIAVAAENNLSHIVREAENMLKKIK
jgi:tetratricopeptide (TPR) repeat protein